jgi:hypothetical protein
MTSPTKWTVSITGFFGLWLLTAPFVFRGTNIARWNDILVGSAILVLSGYNYFRERSQGMLSRHAAAVNGLLGSWLLVSPLMIDVTGLLLWNNVIIGTGTTSLAMYNIYAAPRIHRPRSEAHAEEM